MTRREAMSKATYDDSALANQALGLGEIVRVPLLVRVDENEVEWGLGVHLEHRLVGGSEDYLDFAGETGVVDVLLRNLRAGVQVYTSKTVLTTCLCVFLLHLECRELSVSG